MQPKQKMVWRTDVWYRFCARECSFFSVDATLIWLMWACYINNYSAYANQITVNWLNVFLLGEWRSVHPFRQFSSQTENVAFSPARFSAKSGGSFSKWQNVFFLIHLIFTVNKDAKCWSRAPTSAALSPSVKEETLNAGSVASPPVSRFRGGRKTLIGLIWFLTLHTFSTSRAIPTSIC